MIHAYLSKAWQCCFPWGGRAVRLGDIKNKRQQRRKASYWGQLERTSFWCWTAKDCWGTTACFYFCVAHVSMFQWQLMPESLAFRYSEQLKLKSTWESSRWSAIEARHYILQGLILQIVGGAWEPALSPEHATQNTEYSNVSLSDSSFELKSYKCGSLHVFIPSQICLTKIGRNLGRDYYIQILRASLSGNKLWTAFNSIWKQRIILFFS